MIRRIIQFELVYSLKQPAFWAISAAYFLFALLYASSSIEVIGLSTAAINVNSPWAITRMVVQLSYLSLLASAAFVGASVIRDFNSGVSELLFTTGINKRDYVVGRFLGGFLACLMAFSFIFAGIVLGSFAPWADPRQLGAFPGEGLVAAFVVFALPNLFIGSAILFSIALLTVDSIKSYVGAIAIIIGFFISRAFAGAFYASTDQQMIASLAEPFGAYAATMAVLDWSPFERNTIVLWGQDFILLNRAIWLGLAVLLLVAAYHRFRMEASQNTQRKQKKNAAQTRKRLTDQSVPILANRPGKNITQNLKHGPTISINRVQQFLALSYHECRSVVLSTPFLVILCLSCVGVWLWVMMYGRAYGTGFYPYTSIMATHTITVLTLPIIAMLVFYSAESVWQTRHLKINEIVESLPITNPQLFFSKLVALIAASLIMLILGVATAIVYQLSRGFTSIELSIYAQQIFFISQPYFMVFAALALCVQAVLHSRFVGMLVMLSVYILIISADSLGLINNLLIPGTTIKVIHNNFAGFGHYLESMLWFNAYWMAALSTVSIVCALLLARGTELSFAKRIAAAKENSNAVIATALVSTTLLTAGLGGYIYRNTHLLNSVTTEAEKLEKAYSYEKHYAHLKHASQPKITAVNGKLNLFPDSRSYEFTGEFKLINDSDESIKQLVLTAPINTQLVIQEDSGQYRINSDTVHDVITLDLATPFSPKQVFTLPFSLIQPPGLGFRNAPKRTPVAYDGSIVFYTDFLPTLGYSRSREIKHENDREDFGLGGRVSSVRAQWDGRGAMEQEGQTYANWLTTDITIETDNGQIAIGQGELVSREVVEDRIVYRYKSNVPVKLHMGITSANYHIDKKVVAGLNHPISLEVYSARLHTRNNQQLLSIMQRTIAVLEDNFGAYPYKQLRYVEADFGKPNCRIRTDTLICDSSLGFINDPALDDPRSPPSILEKIPAGMISNLYVQAINLPANYPGATSIADGLGFYLSSLVWRDSVTPESVAETIRDTSWKYFLERAKGEKAEAAIVDQVNQTFIGAHKNAISMYALELYMGKPKMIAAIKRYLDQYRFAPAPFNRMSDLVAVFRDQATPETASIIDDLFTNRTVFEISVSDAQFRQLDDQRYETSFVPIRKKFYSSPEGQLTEVEFDYPIEIAVFGQLIDNIGSREILHRDIIDDSDGRIIIVTDEEPTYVGLDPFYRLLDRDFLNNRTPVTKASM